MREHTIFEEAHSWFGYSEEKFEFFLSYIIEGRILSIQLDNYIIKNIKFYLIIVTTEKLLLKEY